MRAACSTTQTGVELRSGELAWPELGRFQVVQVVNRGEIGWWVRRIEMFWGLTPINGVVITHGESVGGQLWPVKEKSSDGMQHA